MEDYKVYIRPPDWWPEPVPEGKVMFSCFSNAFMAPSKLHEGGTFTYLDGWGKMVQVIQRFIMRRHF
jgi:hypothetical protein